MPSSFRRKQGTPTVGVQVDIAPEVKMLIDHYMAAANVPQWAIIEAAIRAGRPGADGIPEGWDLPKPQCDHERPMKKQRNTPPEFLKSLKYSGAKPLGRPSKGKRHVFVVRLPDLVAAKIMRIANACEVTYQDVLCALVCAVTGDSQLAPDLPPVPVESELQETLDFPEEGDAASSP